MERQIVEVKEEKKTSKPKKKVDIKKVAKVIVENKDTIEAVATTLGTLINSSNNSKTTSKKGTTKKTTTKKKTTTSKKKSSSSDDAMSTLVDLLLKK